MPLDIPVACLVIDEIQLCADPERGHVFTDRLLHARGEEETMFLGSDTMRGIIQRFVPADLVHHPRRAFPISPIPAPRSSPACPAARRWSGFSAEDVYGIAELIRRQRGGAAVVLGALSPAHPQRAGRALPVRRCRFPGRDRRHRHGPQHGCRPCRLRRAREVRRRAACGPLRPDEIGQIAGPRRALHE